MDAEEEEEQRLRQAVMRPSTFAIHGEFVDAQARHSEVMPVRFKRAMFSLMRGEPAVKPSSFFPQHGATVGELATLHVLVPPQTKKAEGGAAGASSEVHAVECDEATEAAEAAEAALRAKQEQQRERARLRERERQRNRVRVRNRAKPKPPPTAGNGAGAPADPHHTQAPAPLP